MANSTKVALLFGIIVFLQVACAVSRPHALGPGKFVAYQIPATLTLNGFQKGEGGGGPASCDGQYHSDDESIVSLSSPWYYGGGRCGKLISISPDNANDTVYARVVDECRDCDKEVGASTNIWRLLNLDPSIGEVNVIWSDVYH